MASIEQIELPLFEAFQRFCDLDRQTGHKGLDMSSYLELLDIMRRGGILMAKEDLLFLCEKLWLKPYHDNNPILNRTILRTDLNAALAEYLSEEIPVDGDAGATDGGNEISDPVGTGIGDPGGKIPAKEEIREEQKKPLPGGWNGKVADTGKYSLYITDIPPGKEQASSSLSDREMDDLVSSRRYVTRGDYMPVNQRHIEQTVRSNRVRITQRTTFALDIVATIDKITRTGNFADYVLKKEDRYGTDWKILIDHEGSMVAFQVFAEEFAHALVNERIGGQTVRHSRMENRILYFKNCPVNYLYTDPGHKESVPLRGFAAARPMNILIISDAGAARGNYNNDRVRQTYAFLKGLKGHKVAWLNPVPKRRWNNSSAETIATLTDMFEIGEMNASRLGNIVRLFKSKINRSTI